LRVIHYLPLDHLDAVKELGLRSGYGSQRLSIGGIKLFADGALGSQTALLLKPYQGSRSNCGIAVLSREELIDRTVSCARAGLSCAIHAIGDLANRNALDAIESAIRARSPRLRHRIEHCQIVAPADVHRFKRLGVVASMQPSHATADIDIMKKYLGRRRYHSYRFRTFTGLGVPLAFGSDAPIEPLNPLLGIQALLSGRPSGGGECFNNSQLLSPLTAIRGFTLGGAIAVGQQAWRGSLDAGKKADFVIWDRDLTRQDATQVERAEVIATYVDGVPVYSQEGFDG
jgi:predicted amidohydrolase YtcJ